MCHASEFLHLKCGRGATINYQNAGSTDSSYGSSFEV
jgi:hypothetical protein